MNLKIKTDYTLILLYSPFDVKLAACANFSQVSENILPFTIKICLFLIIIDYSVLIRQVLSLPSLIFVEK